VTVALRPGELVVRRIRWKVDAGLLGLVIGCDQHNWLVLWSSHEIDRTSFRWHLADALEVVDSSNINELRKRCIPHI